MAIPTTNELISAMLSRGVTISESEAGGIICMIASIEGCLNENYDDECIVNAIMLWSAILIAASTSARYITSHHAPSGASQSFGYGSKPWMSLYNQMKMLDSSGCTGDLVEDPSASAKPWLAVVSGRRICK